MPKYLVAMEIIVEAENEDEADQCIQILPLALRDVRLLESSHIEWDEQGNALVDRAGKETNSLLKNLRVLNRPMPEEAAAWELNLASVWNRAVDAVKHQLWDHIEEDDNELNYTLMNELEKVKKDYRPAEVEELFRQRDILAQKMQKNDVSEEDQEEYRKLQRRVGELPTGRDPWDIQAMSLIHAAALLLKYPMEKDLLFNAALEEAALLVCPEPHVEEERSCSDIAAQIRALKKY